MPNWSSPDRCNVCRLPQPLCVCGLAPRLKLKTHVTLVIHTKEWKRSSNTGRFVPLAVEGAQIRYHGLQDQKLTDTDIHPHGSPIVLFPGCGAKPLTTEVVLALPHPVTLVVPDGNWNQANHMMRRLPSLMKAPIYQLPGPEPGLRRMRRNIFEDRMSTFEAVIQALALFEGPEIEDPMLDFFRIAVDRMLMLRGKIKAADIFGGLPEA